MEEQGIISPIQFSSWSAPIVPVVKQDGTVRICGDYKVTINPALQVDSYPIPELKIYMHQCQEPICNYNWKSVCHNKYPHGVIPL